jgi:hypothetical protein
MTEKMIEAARIIKEYVRFLEKWRDEHSAKGNPTLGASIDFMKQVIGTRMHVSFPVGQYKLNAVDP